MLTGTRLFDGETVSHTLADVLRAPIEFERLPAATPRAIRELVKRCLDRDVTTRLRDIGEARVAIQRYLANPVEEPDAGVSGVRPSSRARTLAPWAIAALALAGFTAMSYLRYRGAPAEQPRVHLTVPLPGNQAPGHFALSPDGRLLVMEYQGGLGLHSLESGEIRPLNGTQLARTPFWSPDSRSIGFFAGGRLKTVSASGGPAQTLCEINGVGGGGGTWNASGTILFSDGTLVRVPAGGGACTAVAGGEPGMARRIPVFLPDGDHFLYEQQGSTDESKRGLYAASLSDTSGRRLLPDQSSAVFVPTALGSSQGRLLFVRDQALMAQAFDAASLTLSGEPARVASQVTFTNTTAQIAASSDDNGTLVYLANGRPDRQLIWYDRSGAERGRAATIGPSGGAAVSLAPDGKKVAFRRPDADGRNTLWVQDLGRNQETRLTTAPLNSSGGAAWSPDSQFVAFGANREGSDAIYVMSVNGGKPELLVASDTPALMAATDWSRDGRWVVYSRVDQKTNADMWLFADPSKRDGQRPIPLLRTPSTESEGQISPDGRWLAYVSDESGTFQVYVRPFGSPLSDTKWQVSSAAVASFEPRWRADGKELFFLDASELQRAKVMAVPIGAAPNPVGAPLPLFVFRSIGTNPAQGSFLYSPAADGQRFLVNAYAGDVQPSLEVILNWGRTAR